MRQVPAVLAFALLYLQAVLPWTAHHFVSEDGASHVYESVVARDLATNPSSPYHSVYAFQRTPVPNWTSTILLAAFVSVGGVAHAEQLLVTFSLAFGFFAFSYAAGVFSQDPDRWSPLANVLLQTFFLTRGYYNLQIGMALGLFVLGYGVQNLRSITPLRTLLLAAGWIALYFTHLLPAVLTMMAFAVISLWVLGADIVRSRPEARGSWFTLSMLGASLVPALILVLANAQILQGVGAPSNALTALKTFPMYLFWISSGFLGHQQYVLPALACLVSMALVSMESSEWASARGGLAIATVLTFCLYLFVPDQGFGGGGEIKVRFAWAVLLFAGILASSVPLPRLIWYGFAVYFAIAVAANLVSVMRVNARASRFFDAYHSVLDGIPNGSTVIRLRYPTLLSSAHFGVPNDLLFVPMLHTDSYVAADRGLIELTNYEAATRIFPIVFQPRFTPEQQWLLWTLDNSEIDGSVRLKALLKTLPVAVDYYVVLGEEPAAQAGASDLSRLLRDLESSGRHLVKSAGDPPFARLYH